MRRSLVVSLVLTVLVALGALAATIGAGWAPKLGLDLAGGLEVVYRPAHKVPSTDVNEAITIMRNRVDGLGVSGATVGSQAGDITVQMPGITDTQKVLSVLGSTAELLFRPVLCTAPPYTPPSTGKTKGAPAAGSSSTSPGPLPSTCPAQYQTTAANMGVKPDPSATNGFTTNNVPPDPALASYPNTPPAKDVANAAVLLPAAKGTLAAGTRYLLGPAQLTGNAIASASAQFATNQWVVAYTLTSAGSAEWDKVAQENFHQMVALDLDGQVESAPFIQPTQSSFTSFGGQGQISGGFSQSTAKQLALVLQYGALPVRLDRLTTQTVSPTLGKSSLRAGLLAGLAGLALVMLYTIVYYRALGLVVVTGLAVTAALLWSIVSALGHSGMNLTLDLAGVTGLIVSVGITVDSYIVYFERLKDEARAGRSVRTSVDKGFAGAFRTVLAADAVSFIGAFILWWLAVGTVKGFAFFLGLSTLLDVFTTFFFTRPLVVMLGRNRAVTEAKVFGVAKGLAVGGQGAS
ncbi:MAG: protein translocase subunit SecD [Acidimicrobiales bacterium]